jgi:RNA polymerase sigma-70 factor (ECF subfamily)
MTIPRREFEKLALEQIDTLYRMARRLCGRAGGAEDLVQETYLRALSASGKFQLEEFGIRPWLLRIMHNLHITRMGRNQRQPQALDESQLDTAGFAAAAVEFAAGETADLFEGMDEQLAAALEELPPEYQQVMLLWAVEDLSYKEIAIVMDVPIGTVMSRLHRARQKLSTQLHDYAQRNRLIRE